MLPSSLPTLYPCIASWCGTLTLTLTLFPLYPRPVHWCCTLLRGCLAFGGDSRFLRRFWRVFFLGGGVRARGFVVCGGCSWFLVFLVHLSFCRTCDRPHHFHDTSLIVVIIAQQLWIAEWLCSAPTLGLQQDCQPPTGTHVIITYKIRLDKHRPPTTSKCSPVDVPSICREGTPHSQP